ncbi:MAG TPA: zinc-binding dehydrogenase, partial [Kribbella sp.]|uniref:zinc-binding dehydrogenase n=1 Tax=Kribbella sp. TaxID=1871183 RepID=UPI002D788869
FGKKFWEIAGERRDPAIVFEHPGAATIATSILMCQPGGMVVICAGTTGFDAMVDLRYHWTRQKRFQGSHGTNDKQAIAYNDLVRAGKIDPVLGRTLEFDGIPRAHAEMGRGEEVFGNTTVLVGSPDPEQGRA